MKLVAHSLLAFAVLTAQQPPEPPKQARDLRVEKKAPAAAVPAQVSIPRSYALVVGIGAYKNLSAELQLKYAERDAEAMYSILISPEGGNFRAENVHTLIGAKATLANIRHELEEWLPSVAGTGDRVLVYFSGHGFVADGKAYLAPYDVDADRIAQTAYSMDAAGAAYGRIKAKDKILLTDSCHSGALTPDADVQSINRSLADLDRSVFSLTASRDRERSFESPAWGEGHGIFTYYVVKGLEGWADASQDGIVTADELAEYVRVNVREATGGKQNPTSDRGSFDPEMLLAYVAARVRAEPSGAPKPGALIVESNMDGVEVFLDGKSMGVVGKSAPLRLPGIPPGAHTIMGTRLGYEPDGPREETVYPGQERTISIKILIPRRQKKAAIDEFDKGLEDYQKGTPTAYRTAAAHFEKALAEEPTMSKAALYLGRTLNALFDEQGAQRAFQRAIQIDPDYLEARASFAGMLLDIGDVDEAIRQLTLVTTRNPRDSVSFYLLAQAQRMKGLYPQAVDSARASIRLNPASAEPHFWLAEGLRMSGSWKGASEEYDAYLRLSDFDAKLSGKLNYYVLGYLAGLGKKKRAAQQDIWRDLRGLAYLGKCDCERRLADFDAAIRDCQRSLSFDASSPFTHYALGLAYAKKGAAESDFSSLQGARQHFRTMIEMNGDLAEADIARKNLAAIDAALSDHLRASGFGKAQ
jgi:tetratricopeptide (TPR) repeat protein